MSNCYFAIVGTKDNPLYEQEFGPLAKERKDDLRHLNQFVVYSSLDILDEVIWDTNQLYLKVIDRFNDYQVSGYILPSGIKFLLMHDTTKDVKQFFESIHELYIKLLMNPFMELNHPITSGLFDQRVKAYARKYL